MSTALVCAIGAIPGSVLLALAVIAIKQWRTEKKYPVRIRPSGAMQERKWLERPPAADTDTVYTGPAASRKAKVLLGGGDVPMKTAEEVTE